MLNRDKNPEYYRSSKDLFSDFYKKNSRKNLMKTNSACVGSLALESNFSDWFKEKEIPAVDMESSIILSAAKNKEKCRLFYVRCGFSLAEPILAMNL
ncbi:hypothetical protein ATZ36_15015 [Candidatus Endomicrobiellum trichonymphae]|uniref:Nucleoside phosphorylase domain-containing protein n=1 Tax=Endomicrobium trichonymphae TaxID=1408204 RepID=A0A1E5ILS2_ENDTX|nr:hypothetical protein ATZ36_15015 [Candidatus Endomicrobium trichonymphae]